MKEGREGEKVGGGGGREGVASNNRECLRSQVFNTPSFLLRSPPRFSLQTVQRSGEGLAGT